MSLKRLEFQEIFGIKDITTAAMRTAVNDWYNLYYADATPPNEDASQRLPVSVVNRIQKATFAEYNSSSKNEFAQTVIDAVNKVRKKAVQQALIGGQSWIKPLIFGEKLGMGVISRDNVLIFGRDEQNQVTDIGTQEETEVNGLFYKLLERRYINDSGKLTIDTRLFRSDEKDALGSRVPLSTLPQYEGIEDVTEIPVNNIGLIHVTCPAENCVDGSDDPVSVYAAACGIIHNININEAQLCGEFERGESRIIVSNDFLKRDESGRRSIRDNIFVGVDDDPSAVGFNIFSPALRDASFIARKHEYLRDIESLIGLKRGILSDVEAAEKTATEITSSSGDYNLTIMDFQYAWENAVRDAVQICASLYAAYRMPAAAVNDDDVIIDWGNGVLYDRDKTWAEYAGMVSMGLLKPELAVAWYFNLPHDTPADLEKIKTDYMPELQALME